MQNVNPHKRPVGRARKAPLAANTPLPQPLPQPHVPASSIGVDLSSITTSNETTNHFLGAGAVHRPWMKQSDAAPLYLRTGFNRPSLRHNTTNSSQIVDRASNIHSTVPNHPTPISTHPPAEDLGTVQNAQSDVPMAMTNKDDISGSHNNTLQETTRSLDAIEILDLTATDEDAFEPIENATGDPLQNQAQTEPNPSRQSDGFADLPVLQMNDDFDLIMANGADEDAPLDKSNPAQVVQDLPMSTSLRSVPEFPLPRSNLPQLTVATGAVAMQPNSIAHAPRSDVRPMQLPSNPNHSPAALHQALISPAILAQQPFRTASIALPSHTQLLTPENSPLTHSTTLSQNQRPSFGAIHHRRPPPSPQVSNMQHATRYPLINQPIVTPQPASSSGDGSSTVQYSPVGQPAISLVNKGLSYLAVLNSNVQDMSSRMDLNNRQWIMRLPWLQDACQRSDLFFLHLNQLSCMWNMNPQTVLYLGMSRNCDSGFAVLELLFGKNTDLPRELLAFLAGWPNSTYSLEFNEEMKAWTAKMAAFLPKFGANWPIFRQQCLRRKVPPMIAEIIHHLGCPFSTILPRAIFCSIQTSINPTCPQDLQTAVFHYFSTNVVDVQASKPGCSDFPNFKAGYQSIYARYSRTPGLSQEQIYEIRAILMHYDSPTTLNQPTTDRQTQFRASPSQISSNIHASNVTASPRINTTPDAAANAAQSHIRRVSNELRQTATTNSPTSARPMLALSALPIQQASPVLAQQQQSQNLNTPMRVSNPPRAHGRSNAPSPIGLTTQPATTVPILPLLNSGRAPAASERLLPVDLAHLPDFLVNPDSIQESLHQVHLRQPLTELTIPLSSDQRLYQYIQSFALEPYPWLPSSGFISLTFDVSDEVLKRRCEAIEQPMGPFVIPKRMISTDAVLFNLRCAKIGDRQSANELDVSWAALPTFWPQHIFISINDNYLEIRRKRHNRRDLPIDVTPFVVSGKNEVKISIHPEANERNVKHGVAVEVIGFCNHDRAVTLPKPIDADKSLKGITSTMTPQQSPDDDDLVLIDDSMTISITDPFSSRIFTIPVRGRSCKHRECFDLETFLKSRQSDDKDAITSVYAWQCPICKEDARPCNLVVDGFFRDVRNRVVEQGLKEARAVVVRADGSWDIGMDAEGDGTAKRSSSRQRNHGRDSAAATGTKAMKPDGGEAMGDTNGQQQHVSNTDKPTATPLLIASSRVTGVIELD